MHLPKNLLWHVFQNAFLVAASTLLHAEDFQLDPATVQHFGAGYRYPQSGWVMVHIEGDPYERGLQHGRLLAPEISGFIRALASADGVDAAEKTWRTKRSFVNAMFARRFTDEQLLEMQGIADGGAAAGAQFLGHPLDLLDIVCINTAAEMESIEVAMSATPTGLEELRPPEVPQPQPRRVHPRGEHCCAFAANGTATRDGKIVFGHITTDDLRPACYFNIWLDLKPTAGHRFVMQTTPGGIYSSMDYSISDTGIVMGETNISQTTFDPAGTPLASRVRQAVQYAKDIDQAVEIMSKTGNGLGSAEWVLADLNHNEIALLVMGTHQNKLFRSSRNEWISEAEGFYWSCNNAKDRAVRLESLASKNTAPTAVAATLTTKRDNLWLQFYDDHKGRIDAESAQLALTTPALATAHAVDCVFTTTDLGLKLESWGHFGPPSGITRMPAFQERQRFPEIRPLVANPWTVLRPSPPPAPKKNDDDDAVDLHDPVSGGYPGIVNTAPEPPHPQLWRGTLLPANDHDIWFTNAFAFYRGLATREKYYTAKNAESGVDERGMDDLATELFYYRSVYEQGARSGVETPLSQVKATYRDEAWNRISLGKGVLLLHSLKGLVGATKFEEIMEEFGREYAGKEVSSRGFEEFVEKATNRSWKEFFDAWLDHTGLPILELGKTECHREGERWHTTVEVRRNESGGPLMVSVTVETENHEASMPVRLESLQGSVEIITDEAPIHIQLDKYRTSACGNGVPFTALTFDNDLEHSLILYGTLANADANREAATLLQQALRRREHDITTLIKADTEATDEDLRTHHLILLGYPSTNTLAARFQKKIPVHFSAHSFSIRGDIYANPETSVLVAAENPLNRRFSMVLYAGLESRAMIDLARKLEEDNLSYAPLILLPAGQKQHTMVLCPPEFSRNISPAKDTK